MTPNDVYPAPEDGGEHPVIEAGPWMDGAAKPTREGMYLRSFDEGEAMSWWRNGAWQMDPFWDNTSDIQDAPWRGGVLRAGKTDADYVEGEPS